VLSEKRLRAMWREEATYGDFSDERYRAWIGTAIRFARLVAAAELELAARDSASWNRWFRREDLRARARKLKEAAE